MATTGGVNLDLRVRGLAVIAQLGYLPDAVVGALRVRILDLVAHQRASVGKHVAADFPSGRRAQKMWFARSFQYTDNQATELAKVSGGSFAIGLEHGKFDIWALLQAGGRVSAAGPMLIPFAFGASGRSGVAVNFAREWGDLAAAGKLNITPSGVVYKPVDALRRTPGLATLLDANGKRFDRGIALGVIRKDRMQPKRLKFFESLEEILPRHAAEFERIFDLALTAAGREQLVKDTEVQLRQLTARLAGGRPGGVASRVRKAAGEEAARSKLNPIISITPGRAS